MKRIYERNEISKISHSFMSNIILKFYSSREDQNYNKKAFEDEFMISNGYKSEKLMINTVSIFWFIISIISLLFMLALVILGLAIGLMVIDPDVILWATLTLPSLNILYVIKLQKLKTLQQIGKEGNSTLHTPAKGFFVEVKNSDLLVPLIVGILFAFMIFT